MYVSGRMTNELLGMCALAVSLALVGCDENKGDGEGDKPTGSATSTAAASGETKPAVDGAGKCEALGCTGEGTFFKMCDCKGKPQTVPFKAKWTGKANDFFKRQEFEVTNSTDKEVHWASAAVYYYDKAGKQLETKIDTTVYKVGRENGSTLSLKPNETKVLSMGFKTDQEPKGVDSIEVVFDGWCFGKYDDKPSHLCVSIDKSPDDRPKSGG